jgi:hypothetical protein
VELDTQKDEDHGRVSHEGHCEDPQDQGEEEDLSRAVIENSKTDEERVASVVFPQHPG